MPLEEETEPAEEELPIEEEAVPVEEELPPEEEAAPAEEELPVEEETAPAEEFSKNISQQAPENIPVSVIKTPMLVNTSDIRSLLRLEGSATEKPLKEILVSSVPFVFGAAVRFQPNVIAGEPLVPADNVVVSVLKEKDDPYFKG